MYLIHLPTRHRSLAWPTFHVLRHTSISLELDRTQNPKPNSWWHWRSHVMESNTVLRANSAGSTPKFAVVSKGCLLVSIPQCSPKILSQIIVSWGRSVYSELWKPFSQVLFSLSFVRLFPYVKINPVPYSVGCKCPCYLSLWLPKRKSYRAYSSFSSMMKEWIVL